MTIIEVVNDPTRPFIIHLRKQAGPIVQVSSERKQVEIESTLAHNRPICIHRLHQFVKDRAPEAVCERDDLKFIAVREHIHAH